MTTTFNTVQNSGKLSVSFLLY